MRSPEGGHELRRLEGNASDIWNRGDGWVKLGNQMGSTATELRAIGDSSVHKSKGTDKLAESASDSAGDLESAGIRYHETGLVLRDYATALSTAQTWIHPNIDEIEAAERAYQSARDAKSDAQGDVDGLDSRFPWEDEPTDADRTAAGNALSDASGDVTSTGRVRDDLWETFDTKFEDWSDAYDDAVDGIQKAMDTADNNDGAWWDFVDDLLTVLTIVLIVLSVVALIIGAPLFGALGLLILGLTLLSVGLTALKYFAGRATLSDLAWSLAGLIPFGLGKFVRGAPALASVVRGGRGVATAAIRSSLPSVLLRRPSTWGTPIRWLFAGRTARLALPRPGLLVNPFRSFTQAGPKAVQVQNFLNTMRNSPWAGNPSVSSFISSTTAHLPGIYSRAGHAGIWVLDNAFNVTDFLNVQPSVPGLREVRYG